MLCYLCSGLGGLESIEMKLLLTKSVSLGMLVLQVNQRLADMDKISSMVEAATAAKHRVQGMGREKLLSDTSKGWVASVVQW